MFQEMTFTIFWFWQGWFAFLKGKILSTRSVGGKRVFWRRVARRE
jgi:hypothetical protein